MNELLQKIQSKLNGGRLSDNLTPLFCETLRWGALHGMTPRSLAVGAPVGATLTAIPVAQLSGLPVLRVDWPGDRLPSTSWAGSAREWIAPHMSLLRSAGNRPPTGKGPGSPSIAAIAISPY